ncbi:hypothetical protein ACWF62_18800 [Rhodococcus sp. NPDC054953]
MEGRLLGRWITFQRKSHDKLTVEQWERLDGLPGWSWDARKDSWDRKFSLLQQFQQREGHGLVPQGHIEPTRV